MKLEIEELIARWPLIKEFKLPEEANVIIIGAYKGLAMEALADLYSNVHIAGFEPQHWAWEEATERLKNYPNLRVLNMGLGIKDDLADMGEWHTDGASFINTGPGSREHGTARLIEANWALTEFVKFEHIDLMMINCEGYEYYLIPYLRDKGWLDKIDRLAVQWHLFPQYDLDHDLMDAEIEDLITKDNFLLHYDERPTWTYFVKDLS